MTLTEEEAREKKRCAGDMMVDTCSASECMAWRWVTWPHNKETGRKLEAGEGYNPGEIEQKRIGGYCGLAGETSP